jgi:hypothetical protein
MLSGKNNKEPAAMKKLMDVANIVKAAKDETRELKNTCGRAVSTARSRKGN